MNELQAVEAWKASREGSLTVEAKEQLILANESLFGIYQTRMGVPLPLIPTPELEELRKEFIDGLEKNPEMEISLLAARLNWYTDWDYEIFYRNCQE